MLTLTLPVALLDADTTYFWRTQFVDTDGWDWNWCDPSSFSTDKKPFDDQDRNGIPDDQQVDGETDLNGNGIPDGDEDMPRVMSPDGEGQIGLTINAANQAIDFVGVLVIIVGAILSTYRFLFRAHESSYNRYRQDLGRSILLGLEFLIAGDIIRTVVVAPTLNNVIVLGIIVLIRTFLSIALHMEIEGRWPWQSAAGTSDQ